MQQQTHRQNGWANEVGKAIRERGWHQPGCEARKRANGYSSASEPHIYHVYLSAYYANATAYPIVQKADKVLASSNHSPTYGFREFGI